MEKYLLRTLIEINRNSFFKKKNSRVIFLEKIFFYLSFYKSSISFIENKIGLTKIISHEI